MKQLTPSSQNPYASENVVSTRSRQPSQKKEEQPKQDIWQSNLHFRKNHETANLLRLHNRKHQKLSFYRDYISHVEQQRSESFQNMLLEVNMMQASGSIKQESRRLNELKYAIEDA